MIVSIMQPAFLPWPGYFHRILSSDVHIVLDNVDIDCNSKTKFTNRNRIRTPQGFCWLTVPLRKDGGSRRINELRVSDEGNWRQKHLRTLDQFYAKAPHYAEHRQWLEELLSRQEPSLLGYIVPLAERLCREMDIATPHRNASDMDASSTKSQLILDLCLEAGATTYLSGPFGRTYLDREAFAREGIEVLFHVYSPKPYRQCFPDFVPALSVVDMLFNHGPDCRELVCSGQENAFLAD